MKSNGLRENQSADLNTLTHPLVLFSISVLLINDHFLKIYSSSWLTGKLSDFAGVFFFPILLSAILNIICKSLNLKQSHIAMTAFGFTVFWFSLIKTIPFFSHLTENLLSKLLSYPSQVICDPTDLIALIMLLPAWRLRTISEKQPNVKKSKLSYLALGIAAIATLATGGPLITSVQNLDVYENTIYADVSNIGIFYSSDGGKTWAEVKSNIPTQVTNNFRKSPELPVSFCLPNNLDICYQTGQDAFFQSLDGGKTWNTTWSVPSGRKIFLEHSSSYIELGPYDLIHLEHDSKQVLVAAMGTEGVLVKTDDSSWESIEVGYAGPMSSFESKNIADAMHAVSTEFIWISVMSIVLLFFNVLVNVIKPDNKGFAWLKIVGAISVISFILTVFSPTLLTFSGDYSFLLIINGVSIISEIVFVVSTLSTIFLLFQQLGTNTNKQGIAGLITLVIVWLISCTLFIFWAYGIIPTYETVLKVLIILNVSYLVWFFYRFTIRIGQQRLPKKAKLQ